MSNEPVARDVDLTDRITHGDDAQLSPQSVRDFCCRG
jgi:hypothetical protein